MITETLQRHKLVTIILFGLIGLIIGNPLDNPAICTIMGLMLGLTLAFGEKRH